MGAAALLYLVLHIAGFHKLVGEDADGIGALLEIIGTLYSFVYAFATYVIRGQFAAVENEILKESGGPQGFDPLQQGSEGGDPRSDRPGGRRLCPRRHGIGMGRVIPRGRRPSAPLSYWPTSFQPSLRPCPPMTMRPGLVNICFEMRIRQVPTATNGSPSAPGAFPEPFSCS